MRRIQTIAQFFGEQLMVVLPFCLGALIVRLGYAAKHEGMNKAKKTLRSHSNPDAFLYPPAYPKTASEVIRRLKQSVDVAERLGGEQLNQKDFGRLIGAPKSTIHDWFHGNLVSPINHFLCGLERLSEMQRTELLRDLCRTCPRLTDSRLAQDPMPIEHIKSLLRQPTGLNVILGPNDKTRTFLITAIGNSAGCLVPKKMICGLDMHKPDWFVPVPGIVYFAGIKSSAEAEACIRESWNCIKASGADIFFFNGLWDAFPDLQADILGLARRRPVLVADGFQKLPCIADPSTPLNIIRIRVDHAHGIHIQVERGENSGLFEGVGD